MIKNIKILAIESSCDDTAAAVIQFDGKTFKVLSSIVSSQVKIHARYGGVVPEVAARKHVERILPLINSTLNQASVKLKNLSAIAFTGGPGLVTSLLVGTETAKSLSYATGVPLIKINHIEGHIYSALVNSTTAEVKKIFPALCLIVSGGHTELILMKDHGKYKRVGGTRDDAVGEAFDKVAKMMDLGYPGGPIVSAWASKFSGKSRFELPRLMINSGDLEMSFSGIKTSVLYKLNELKKTDDRVKAEMCYEFQEAATDVLISKTLQAAEKYKVNSLILGGGVSANKVLRGKLDTLVAEKLTGVKLYKPELIYSGDNAVMIGVAACFHYLNKDFITPFGFRPNPNWELV